jgi:hypothetical protein
LGKDLGVAGRSFRIQIKFESYLKNTNMSFHRMASPRGELVAMPAERNAKTMSKQRSDRKPKHSEGGMKHE